MELELHRSYFPEGTNGVVMSEDLALCHSIELPWRDNLHEVSCIPEGRYQLVKRYSDKFRWHLQLLDVTGRDLILIHPANDALKELKGCIAPVTRLMGIGKGSDSRIVFNKLKAMIYPVLDANEKVFITIKPAKDEHSSEGKIAHTEVF